MAQHGGSHNLSTWEAQARVSPQEASLVTNDEFWASPRLHNEILPQKSHRKERKTVKVLFKCYRMQESVEYKMANKAPLW